MSGIQVNYQQYKDMLTDYKLNESTSEKYNLDSLSPSLFSFPRPLFFLSLCLHFVWTTGSHS